MKPKPLTREQQIFEWKVEGKGISWARWCALNGYKVVAPKKTKPK